MTVQAVILAGGLGTRLRPLTLERPKPVVPLLNVPFLSYQLGLLGAHGVRDVILSISHRSEAIREIMARERLGAVRLRDVVERDPLGTAGGVRNAADLVDGRVVVMNGDVLTELDLTAMLQAHEARGAAATIYLMPVDNPTAYGLVELEPDGRVRRFLEKPGWEEVTTNTVNAGVYVLERDLLELIPKGEAYSMEREFFPLLLERGVPFYGFVSPGYWVDIGTPAKYFQAQQDLLARRFRAHVAPDGRRGPRGVDPPDGDHRFVGASSGSRGHRRPLPGRGGRGGGPGRRPRCRLPDRGGGPPRYGGAVGGCRGRRGCPPHGVPRRAGRGDRRPRPRHARRRPGRRDAPRRLLPPRRGPLSGVRPCPSDMSC